MNEKPTILYVDDEESNLTTFKAAFRRSYTVLTANSPRQAIKILKESPVQLIITDQRMPEMTGVQFLEAILSEYPNPVRMILTGFSDVDAIIKAINKGCVFRYLTKPWNASDLQQTIDAGLRFYELMRSRQELIEKLKAEVQNQERILRIFKKYDPSGNSLENLTSDHLFKGEFRIVAILFSSITWRLDLIDEERAIQDIALLNQCFSIFSQTIQKHKGVIDKFIGSSILTLFGAPVSYIDNQDNAILCAAEMEQRFDEFCSQLPDEVSQNLKLYSSIHIGNVVVGNIGSKDRMAYTAIGDAVNVAARILEIAKTDSHKIIITENMKAVAEEYAELESLGTIHLRGREVPLELYNIKKIY